MYVAVDPMLDQPRSYEVDQHARGKSNKNGRKYRLQDSSDYISPASSQCYPYTKFVRPARNDVGRNAIKTNGTQRHS